MKETIVIRELTSKECLALFNKKRELIEKRNEARQEWHKKRIEINDLNFKVERMIADIDRKLPKFLIGLK